MTDITGTPDMTAEESLSYLLEVQWEYLTKKGIIKYLDIFSKDTLIIMLVECTEKLKKEQRK